MNQPTKRYKTSLTSLLSSSQLRPVSTSEMQERLVVPLSSSQLDAIPSVATLSLNDERRSFRLALSKALVLGEKWQPINLQWIERWKQFVNYDDMDNQFSQDEGKVKATLSLLSFRFHSV
jgi:hypothetical protein